MQVVRKKASLPDISLGKSTEPLKTRQYVTAETLTTYWSIRTAETLTADRSPLYFGDVGHAEIVRNMDLS